MNAIGCLPDRENSFWVALRVVVDSPVQVEAESAANATPFLFVSVMTEVMLTPGVNDGYSVPHGLEICESQ